MKDPPVPETADAMDKVLSRLDVCQATYLVIQDAMDKIVCSDPQHCSLNVEMNENMLESNGISGEPAPVQQPVLNVETPHLKDCHVCVTPLEDIVFDRSKTKPKPPPPEVAYDLPTGEHYT